MQGRSGHVHEVDRPAWITPPLIQVVTRHLQLNTGRDHADERPRKLAAIDIANRFDLFSASKHETRRRRIRELIDAIRAAGHPIAADGDGVWHARIPEDHQIYQGWRRKHGLAHLAAASRDKHSPAAAQAAGQGGLFQ